MALVANGPRGGQVAACCSTAATQGVRTDMPLAEAQAWVRELAIAPHEPPADRRALEKLAEACEQFTPCMALEEGDEPESLLLDISNLEHLWGSESELAAQVEQFFTRRGYRVRLAVAETVGLAWALAHFVAERAGSSPSPAEDCKLHFAIPSLPVEALRIPDETASLFRQLGICTIEQLFALPRKGLASRFGESLLRRLDQFTGAAREVIEPHRALAALEMSHALDEPTGDRAALLHVLNQLVERLVRRLAARDEGAVLLMCRLQCTGGRSVMLRIGLLEPSANAGQILELIDLHLETVTLSDEVDRVEIRAAVVGRLGERQRELFADHWPTDPHQLALLVNRLSSRLGYEQVLRARLRASPVPERAVQFVPVTQRAIKKLQNANCKMQIANWQGIEGLPPPKLKNLQFRAPPAGWSCNLQSPRPLWLHPQPQPLEVVCIAPDGPPQFVWLDHRRQRIVHCVGPERIETLWWRGPSLRRDYYRIATESGSHPWIFRRLTDAHWFLHGMFE